MNKTIQTTLAIAGLVAFVGSAQAVSIDIGSVNESAFLGVSVGSTIAFNGASQFSFTGATAAGTLAYLNGAEFVVNTGTAAGARGDISGTFTIGAITTVGGVQTANVTSSAGATLSIIDSNGDVFSGLINWVQIKSEGTANNLNVGGVVNLTSITYVGSNADLLALKGPLNQASATLQFGFNPAKSVSDLVATTESSSFTGDITSIPDGGLTLTLLGSALAGLGLFVRRSKA